MYRKPITRTVTVPATGTESEGFPLRNYVIAGIFTPAVLTSISVTFEAAPENGDDFVPVVDSAGNAIAITVAADQAVAVTGAAAEALAAFSVVRLVTASAEAAARTFVIALK